MYICIRFVSDIKICNIHLIKRGKNFELLSWARFVFYLWRSCLYTSALIKFDQIRIFNAISFENTLSSVIKNVNLIFIISNKGTGAAWVR